MRKRGTIVVGVAMAVLVALASPAWALAGTPDQSQPNSSSFAPFAPPDGTTPPDGTPPPPDAGSASNDFSFGKVKKNKRDGRAKLTVIVPGGGDLVLAKTEKVRAAGGRAEVAGEVELPIKPRGKAQKKLKERGRAKVNAKVTYMPDGGGTNTESKEIKLVRR